MTTAQWLQLALMVSITLTVFGLGLTATFQDATYLLRRPAQLVTAFVSMNIVMPVIAVLIAITFNFPFVVKLSLVALCLSPVPPIIQKKQLSLGGRMDYVVGLMVAMSLLSIVFVPLVVAIFDSVFDRQAALAPWKVAKIMLITVLVPLLIGLAVRKLFPKAEKASGPIRAGASILLLVGLIPLLIGLWPSLRPLLGNGVVLVMIALAVMGLAVGHYLGGPRTGDRAALAISTCSRHPAVALAIATAGSAVESKQATAVILLYLLVGLLVCIPYQLWVARSHASEHA